MKKILIIALLTLLVIIGCADNTWYLVGRIEKIEKIEKITQWESNYYVLCDTGYKIKLIRNIKDAPLQIGDGILYKHSGPDGEGITFMVYTKENVQYAEYGAKINDDQKKDFFLKYNSY